MRRVSVFDPSVPLCHAALSLDVGSLADPQGKEGATRLLLRLMRRSVQGLSPEQLEETMDRMGASFGIELNRSVSSLSGSVIARSRPQFFELFERMVTAPAFDEEEFLHLRDESVAEWEESLDNDSILARRFFLRTLFRDHPYGRLPAGTPASLTHVNLADLETLHGALFVQPRLLASFAGDFQNADVEPFLARLEQGLPSAPGPEFSCPDPTAPIGRRLVFVDKPERSQTQILIGGLGSHPHDEDHTALVVANTIFGGTFTSRLSHEVRGERGWSYGASSHLPFDRRRHGFWMWTFPKSEDALACVTLQLELLESFLSRGVTAAELAAAKRYIKNSHPFTVDTATKRASLLVDEQIYQLPEGYYAQHVARAQAVTRAQIQSALERRLSHENLIITVVGSRAPLFEQLKTGIPRLTHSEVVPFDLRD